MRKSVKLLVAAIAILVFSTSTITAQEKYDYVELYVKANVVILITNKEYEKHSPPKGLAGEVYGIQYLDKLTNEGWEVINGSVIPDNVGNVAATKYFLKKKKQ